MNWEQTSKVAAAAAIAFAFGLSSTLWSQGEQRFDHQVRNDFFAGFSGNREALERGLRTTKETLAANPDHAEALVWQGAAHYFLGGQAFQAGDSAKGMELVQLGLREMDRGVELAPDRIGVRIPRGAALLQGTLFMPESEFRRKLVAKAISDYERALEMQNPGLDSMGEHPKGELLFGLGVAHLRNGNDDKAREYFGLVEQHLGSSEYARRVKSWRTNGKLSPAEMRCYGCHVN